MSSQVPPVNHISKSCTCCGETIYVPTDEIDCEDWQNKVQQKRANLNNHAREAGTANSSASSSSSSASASAQVSVSVSVSASASAAAAGSGSGSGAAGSAASSANLLAAGVSVSVQRVSTEGAGSGMEGLQRLVTGDDIPAKQVEGVYRLSTPTYFRCPADISAGHIYCPNCFADFVRSDANEWYFGRIPLRCNVEDCKSILSEESIRGILLHPAFNGSYESSWKAYENAALRVGLLDAVKKEANVPIQCQFCSYTALFPANYHERAAKLKIWLDQQKESEKDAARLKALDNKADQEKHEGKEEKNKDGKEEKVHSVSSTKDELNKSTASTSSSSAATAASASVHVAASESLPESLSSLSRQKTDGFSLTSLFFECQTPSCGGVQCLRCDKFLNSADEKLSHLCNVSAMKILHERFTQVLADANTMRCPCCGWVGHKDTACSHMFCEACRNYWCYMCGQQVDPNDEYGGWSVHNSWNFVKQTPGHCPMYLHYRFGGGAINAQHLFTSGDPDESLRLFHIFHVQRAMEQFRAGLSLQEKAMFIEMLELDFPDGVIDENDLKRLAEIDKQIEDHCEQFRKSEEKKKEEEERKKREEDERKLKEVQQQQDNKLKAEQDKKEANAKEEEEKKRDPQ